MTSIIDFTEHGPGSIGKDICYDHDEKKLQKKLLTVVRGIGSFLRLMQVSLTTIHGLDQIAVVGALRSTPVWV